MLIKRLRPRAADKPDGWMPRSLNDWIEGVTNSVVAISAVLALFQYTESLRSQRVDRTLEFVHQFSEGQHLASVSAVDALTQKVRSKAEQSLDADTLASLPANKAASVKEKFLRAVVYEQAETDGGEPRLPPELMDVTGFFNELQVCIERSVCDRDTAHAFFDNYAKVFWANFKPIVDYERELRRPDFARPAERFVAEAKP